MDTSAYDAICTKSIQTVLHQAVSGVWHFDDKHILPQVRLLGRGCHNQLARDALNATHGCSERLGAAWKCLELLGNSPGW